MKVSDLPFVSTVLAAWVWSSDDGEDSIDASFNPSLCLDHIDHFRLHTFLLESGCFSQLVTKILGVVMIVGAFFNKAPTILNLLQTQSAEGLSPMALYSEVLFFTNSSVYSLLMGHPFTAVCNCECLWKCHSFVSILLRSSPACVRLS